MKHILHSAILTAAISSSFLFAQTNHSLIEQKGPNCQVNYMASKQETVDIPSTCSELTILNSGSGLLTITSSHQVKHVTVSNNGSNTLDLSGLKAFQIKLQDSGSGTVNLRGHINISGSTNGSGKIFIDQNAKGIVNNGTAEIMRG